MTNEKILSKPMKAFAAALRDGVSKALAQWEERDANEYVNDLLDKHARHVVAELLGIEISTWGVRLRRSGSHPVLARIAEDAKKTVDTWVEEHIGILELTEKEAKQLKAAYREAYLETLMHRATIAGEAAADRMSNGILVQFERELKMELAETKHKE